MKVLFSVLLILVAISAGCLYNTPYVMASQCNDGIDNDDDGLIDANNSGGDSECAYVDRPSGDPSTWTF